MIAGAAIAAIAWDIDGTLVDSEGLHHRALMAVSANHGVMIAADDDRFVGVAMDDVWNRLRPLYPPDLARDAWLRAIEAAYIQDAPALRPTTGAIAAMAEAQRRGLRQCCVSNSSQAIVAANLAAIGTARFVEFSISRDDVLLGKPDAEPYRAACLRLGLAPAAVIAIEDSDVGACSARAAGCLVIRTGAAEAPFADLLEALAREECIR